MTFKRITVDLRRIYYSFDSMLNKLGNMLMKIGVTIVQCTFHLVWFFSTLTTNHVGSHTKLCVSLD